MSAVRQLAECQGKDSFGTPQLAKKVLRRWLRAKRRQGKRMSTPPEVYRCRSCGLFHLGTPTR